MMWATGPGNGADDWGISYFARGSGIIDLDALHKEPRIIIPSTYTDVRSGLHG